MLDQLQTGFNPILSQHVSGFRKGFECQNLLMKFVEDCKAVLDERKVCGAVLADLSKAFDIVHRRHILFHIYCVFSLFACVVFHFVLYLV